MPAAMLPACLCSLSFLLVCPLCDLSLCGPWAQKAPGCFTAQGLQLVEKPLGARGPQPPEAIIGFGDMRVKSAKSLAQQGFPCIAPWPRRRRKGAMKTSKKWRKPLFRQPEAPGCFTAQGLFSMRRFQAFVPLSAQPRLWVRPLPAPGFFCATARTPKCSWVRSGRR